jgi:hypothetical protein
MGIIKDIVGQRFGKLIVVEFIEIKKNKSYWKCKCDCGNVVITQKGSLTAKRTKGGNYGCKKCCRGESLVGQRFGRLVVEKFLGSKTHSSLWLCKCDCGNLKEKRKADLGGLSSCGCYIKERCSTLSKKSRGKDPILVCLNSILRYYLRNASRRGINFDLKSTDFYTLIKQNCYYCDSAPSNKQTYLNTVFFYNGIDRLNNSYGYELNNSVPCCKICNIAKSNLTKVEFFDWIKRVKNKWNI